MWLHDIVRTSEQAQIYHVKQLGQLKAEIVNLAEKVHEATAEKKPVELSPDAEGILKSLLVALQTVSKRGGDSVRCQEIISSLRFKEMPMRQIQIPETYADTFAWILEDYPLRPWLESSGDTFWLDGKPGSGKSTMMKMLSGSTRTRELLKSWAGPRRLVILSVFFWSSGYPMQRSQLGFLQSLCYQMLRRFPGKIPTLCPRRWQQAVGSEDFDPWSKQELLAIMTNMTAEQEPNTRFCLFIDGLDECEGEHYELVQLLAEIGRSASVKMCVSSRPWNVFRKAFGHSPDRRLVLQDLTERDMDCYITDKLEANAQFRALTQTDPSAHMFPQEIRARAQGVFLWVFLVVRSLLRGLTEDDDMTMLRERFRDIPDDLETCFKRMLNAVDKVYSRYMARSLLLACTAETPLPLSSYSYVDIDHRNPGFAMQAAHQPYTPESFLLVRQNVANLISKWCRDLLEIRVQPAKHRASDSVVDPLFEFQVDFLHRTVRDFLVTGPMQSYLMNCAGNHFRPEATLSRIFLVHAKTIPSFFRDTDHFQYAAGCMMYYVQQHERKYDQTLFDLIYELDRIGNAFCPPSYNTTWAGQRIGVRSDRGTRPSTRSWSPIWDEGQQTMPQILVSSRLHRKRDLIAYAVEFDLRLFVQQTLEQSLRQRVEGARGTPLLYHALSAVLPSELGLPSSSEPHAMVALLFDSHANINVSIPAWSGATLWRVFLHSISAAKPQSTVFDETATLPEKDSRCSPVPKHDTAIRWHFSDLNNICESLCKESKIKAPQVGSVLPWKDATLLESMLHHGADPGEMDRKVLSALLKQCCVHCRTRHAHMTHDENESREGVMRSYHVLGEVDGAQMADDLEALSEEVDFGLELDDEIPSYPGWSQAR